MEYEIFGVALCRIFGDQIIVCRLDHGPLARRWDIKQVLEDRAHNLWFYLASNAGYSTAQLVCKRVDGFELRGPERAVDVADRGVLDVQVAESWQEERPLRLFWRTDGGRWRMGEIGPLSAGEYQVEMIAMGPMGETTPKSIRCVLRVRGPAAWVMPRIVGHVMEDDPILQQARGYYDAPAILEDAVQRSPHNVYYWAAYVDALAQEERFTFVFTDRASRFAERASRDGLKINPRDPVLLAARARVLPPGAAMDVLDELENMPGHAREAQRLKEILRLRLPFPDKREDLMTFGRASRLIAMDQGARALEVLDEGLAAAPKDNRLLALKAMAAALAGKFEQALELQKACDYLQLNVDGSYCGLCDCLLKQGRADLAIRSFGGRQPQDLESAKVLAWAYAQTRDFARAEALLQDDAPWRRAVQDGAGNRSPRASAQRYSWEELLLLRIMVAANDMTRSRQLAAKILKLLRAEAFGRGSHGEPMFWCYRGAVSLKAEYERVSRWLRKEFPDDEYAIKRELGTRVARDWPPDSQRAECVPASQRIAELRARMQRPVDAKTANEIRRELADALADAGQYAEAAKVIAPDAVALVESGRQQVSETIGGDTLAWCVWNRRADAESLHQRDPKLMASVRPLIHDIEYLARKMTGAREPPSAQAVEDKLAAIGPGTIASLFDEMTHLRYGGGDASTCVRVVQRVGGPQDAPVLINRLSEIVREDPYQNESSRAGCRATEDAIHNCLETLTGKHNPEMSREARVKFWLKWWAENAQKVVHDR